MKAELTIRESEVCGILSKLGLHKSDDRMAIVQKALKDVFDGKDIELNVVREFTGQEELTPTEVNDYMKTHKNNLLKNKTIYDVSSDMEMFIRSEGFAGTYFMVWGYEGQIHLYLSKKSGSSYYKLDNYKLVYKTRKNTYYNNPRIIEEIIKEYELTNAKNDEEAAKIVEFMAKLYNPESFTNDLCYRKIKERYAKTYPYSFPPTHKEILARALNEICDLDASKTNIMDARILAMQALTDTGLRKEEDK